MAPANANTVDCLELALTLYADLALGQLDDQVIERARAYALNRWPFSVATAADL
ncbi:MAG: hypothetical protein R3C68_15285 [Myxococcota bacterium]